MTPTNTLAQRNHSQETLAQRNHNQATLAQHVSSQSSTRVVGIIKCQGLTVLSAFEVSLLLDQSAHAAFVLPFKKRQVSISPQR